MTDATTTLTTRTAAEALIGEILATVRERREYLQAAKGDPAKLNEWVRWDGARHGLQHRLQAAYGKGSIDTFAAAIKVVEQAGLLERRTGAGVWFRVAQ